jgi:hypothetical protein
MIYDKLWLELTKTSTEGGLRTIRIDKNCILDLFLALDSKNSHCLVFHLPRGFIPELSELQNENIHLTYVKQSNLILIKLLDDDFLELFDDLIFSLFNSIKHLKEVGEASRIYIETYIKWNVFFTRANENKFGKEKVIGLWGELFFLKNKLKFANTQCKVNSILNSWKGPDGATHDFEFSNLSVEIKTKLESVNRVKISSEYQLQSIDDKALNLTVLSVKESQESGSNLFDLYTGIKSKVSKYEGDISLLLTALLKEGLDESLLCKYDDLRFKCLFSESFDCLKNGFPSIVRTELNEAIFSLNYSLELSFLADFIIDKEVY